MGLVWVNSGSGALLISAVQQSFLWLPRVVDVYVYVLTFEPFSCEILSCFDLCSRVLVS